jgi:dihydropteroate synthase
VQSFVEWGHARGLLGLLGVRVMGVVNLTPDSFSDGGELTEGTGDTVAVAAAVRRCERFVREGADLIDVGGESTRPGSETVGVAREISRVVPLLERLFGSSSGFAVPVSIDTRHAEVARAAMAAGAAIINDVSGLADPDMAKVAAQTKAGLVLGHLRGKPQHMQDRVAFKDLIREVTEELRASVDRALAAGVERDHIVVDPGIGFGKTAEQSAALVASSQVLREATGCPVLIGASRKSFIGAITGRDVKDRLAGSLAAALVAADHDASILRVHDVKETVDALCVARAIREAARLRSTSRSGT